MEIKTGEWKTDGPRIDPHGILSRAQSHPSGQQVAARIGWSSSLGMTMASAIEICRAALQGPRCPATATRVGVQADVMGKPGPLPILVPAPSVVPAHVLAEPSMAYCGPLGEGTTAHTKYQHEGTKGRERAEGGGGVGVWPKGTECIMQVVSLVALACVLGKLL